MKKDIEALEKVQKRATKILPQLKHMNIIQIDLKHANYLHYITEEFETYKILTGKYDVETAPSLVGVCFSVTRGHSLR